MISANVEARMAEANRALNGQNRERPFLINIHDGRLMPNVPRLGGRKENKALGLRAIAPHPDYRVYMGPPKARLEERLRILATQNMVGGAAVVDSSEDVAAAVASFDIGKASRAELCLFALEQYGVAIDNEAGDTHVMKLRAKVRDLARQHGHLDAAAAGGASDLV